VVELILPFDLFELVIQLDALILLEDDSYGLFVLFVKECVDALHLSAGDKSQSVDSFFSFLALHNLLLAGHCNSLAVFEGEVLVDVIFGLAFLEDEDVGVGETQVQTVLLLTDVLEQDKGTVELRQFMVVVLLSNIETTDHLHGLKEFVHFM
jgi:hypothetical protein